MSKSTATVARVGVGNADIRVGGTLYRGVEVSGLDYNQLREGDRVGVWWKGERPYITSLLDYRETEDGIPASVAAAAVEGDVTIIESRIETVYLADDDGGLAEPDSDSEILLHSGTGIGTAAAGHAVTFSHLTGDIGDAHTNYAEYDGEEFVTQVWNFCDKLLVTDTNTLTSTSPNAVLEVKSSSATHLQLSYDGSNYATIKAESDGTLRLTPSGTGVALASGDDFVVDTNLLWADASENKVYINAGSPWSTLPSYRGALTVQPGVNTDKGLVIQGLASQNAHLFQLLDSSGNDLILVTNTGDLESGNPGFVSGLTGWQIAHDGDAEFNDLWCRGEFHCSIFVADEMHATGGTFMVKTCFKVAPKISPSDNTLPAAKDSSFTLVTQASWDTGLCYIADNDLLRLKFMARDAAGTGLDLWDLYLEVNGTPSSNSDRDLTTGNPGTFDVNCVWRTGGLASKEIPQGTGGVVWCKVDQVSGYTGSILLTSDLQYNPYIDIFTIDDTKTGSWSPGYTPPTTTPRVRLGNLDGVLGLSEEWGIAASTDLSNASIDNYIVLSDQQLTIKGVSQYWVDSAGNVRGEVDPTVGDGGILFWLGASESGAKFKVYGDGSTWLSSLVISESTGDFLFSKADGLALWGPNCEISTSEWKTLRGQIANISGSLHQEQGRWAGTQALIVENTSKNWATNPRMYDGNSDNMADDWSTWNSGLANSITWSVTSHPDSRYGWMQKAVYTAGVGDSGDSFTLAHKTGAASFAPSDKATVSIDLMGTLTGTTLYLRLQALTSGDVYINQVSLQITDLKANTPQRYSLTYDPLPATTDKVRITVVPSDIDNGDSVTLYTGMAQVEKLGYRTSPIAGNLGYGYDWNGTADASTSERDAGNCGLGEHIGLISGNNTVSYLLTVQMPYDYDETWPYVTNIFWDARTSDPERTQLSYSTSTDKFQVFLNNAYRLESEAQTFIAGDWYTLVVTCDYSSNEFYLYVNGVEAASDTTSLSAPSIAAWKLGQGYDGSNRPGAPIAQYAVFDRVLTAEEVAAIYALQRPLVDAGAISKPGIYLLDGQFALASSTLGTRLEMNNTRLAIGNGISYGGVGCWLGLDGGTTPKLSVYADANNYLKWDGSNLSWKGASTSLSTAGALTCTSGAIAGWTIDSANIYKSGHVGLVSTNNSEAIWIKNATWQSDGVQMQYNSGSPRFYVGDGSANYLKYTSGSMEIRTGSGAVKLTSAANILFHVASANQGLAWYSASDFTGLCGALRVNTSTNDFYIDTGGGGSADHKDFYIQTLTSGGTRVPLWIDAENKCLSIHGGHSSAPDSRATLAIRNGSGTGGDGTWAVIYAQQWSSRAVAHFDNDGGGPAVRLDANTVSAGSRTQEGYIFVNINGTDRYIPYYS